MTLDADDWQQIIDSLDLASYSELSLTVADRLDLSDAEGYNHVDDALEAGVLVERDNGSSFGSIEVADEYRASEGKYPTQNPGSESAQPAADGGADVETSSPIDDEGSLGLEDIQDHYQRARPALEAIATLDGHPTIGLNDYYGWYIKRDHDDIDLLEDGFGKLGRVATFEHDLDTILDRTERSLYAITTYKHETATRSEQPCTFDEEDGTVWQDNENPTPDYPDIRAAPAWGDIDLRDDIKDKRGGLDEQTRETIENSLEAYIDEFAKLYGGCEAVQALDSVGGAYIFGSPAATLPITEHFEGDEDALGRVMEAVIERSNDWLREAEQRVNERVDGADEVLDPDWVNNKNRQYKAPLSLHTDHDAVVTPIDTASVEYDVTPVEDVDEDLINETVAWGDDLTSTEHTDRVATLVAQLWPDYTDEYDDWRGALEAWVEDERRREKREEQRRRAERERRDERKAELDGSLEGQPVTPFLQDVYDDVDQIDTADVIKNHACDGWDTGRSTSTVTEFDPSWRGSDSGSSCYVDHSANTFGDPGEGGGGYAATAMALGENIISSPTETLKGSDWWSAVDALRDAGYEIRVWTPERGSKRHDGSEYDEMPFWAVRKAAVALGVCPPDAFVEQKSDDGDTYPGFPGPETYNNALEAIEDAGLEHGREYADEGPSYPVYDLVDDDNQDLELHLIPLNGREVRVAVEQNGQREYSETQERGFWDNGTKRGRIAGRIVSEITGVSETALKNGVKSALNSASIDADERDDWDDRMRSPRERELRDRTVEVVCYPAADSAEYVVTMEPGPDSPETEPQEITFDEGDLIDPNGSSFRSAHLAKFHAKIEIDSEEWDGLVDHWLDVQDIRQRDADHETEATVEKFVDWVRTMDVWADEDGFDWRNRNGFYVEDFDDDQDAVLVPGQKVVDWLQREDADDLNLSRALREHDILLGAPSRETINGERRRAWPVAAEKTNHAPESALVQVDEDDENAPEGLR